MDKLVMCRICLGEKLQMSEVVHPELHEVYGKLSGVAFQTEDMKPWLVCYICRALLCKAYKLMISCVRADDMLTQILKAGDEIPLTFNAMKLTMANVYTFSIQEAAAEIPKIPIKDEGKILIQTPILYEEDFKMQKMLNDVEDTIQAIDSIYGDGSPSDPEDDLPLTTIKQEQLTISIDNERIYGTHIRKNSKKEKRRKIAKITTDKDIKRERKGLVKKTNAPPTYTKIELTQEEQMEKLLERSRSNNYLHSPYKCDLCYKGFVDATAYQNHMEKHDERSGAYKCAVCALRYRSAPLLRAHVLTAHAQLFPCTRCAHVAHTVNQARIHQKWHSGFKYDCKLCGREFKNPTTYLSHLRMSHPTEHVCDTCGDSFVGLHGLKMHKTKAHSNQDKTASIDEPAEDRFCSDCNIQFLSRDAWQRHVVCSYRHSIKNDLEAACGLCGWIGAGAARVRHMREHARALRGRAASAHVAPARTLALHCQECGASFSNRSMLKAHINRMHLGIRYNKNVVCEICGKKCTSNATLKYHQRKHTGERPYACATCDKRFADSNHLRIHTRTHTGERPYECTACGKRFSQKPALNRHYRVHTGAKPYTCELCSRGFSQSSSLKLHVRSVHSKQPSEKRRRQKVPAGDLQKATLDPDVA